ncbi:MAG TPA: protein kinase [Thermoanaerobaculia bacterium]|jgi:serine/threonine-protein kinase|nr:protein kinase [Thermoanaerobaculia bacterium]
MTSTSESSLLRLAIAKGLLRWEDLDSVADHLPEPLGSLGPGSGSPLAPEDGRWVRALIEAGFLTPETVAGLAAELQGSRDDLTPDLTGDSRPFPPAGPLVPEPAHPAKAPALPPELRFLADWTRYRVELLLGSGGMGTVYKAFDPTLGRWIALKFLHRNDAQQTERFLREARAQARVGHPNVCQVHEVGEVEGRPYIAMQYIDGRSLGELTEELSIESKVQLLRDVARAVHAAHRTGLIHRDLKPGNILLARDESGALHPFVVDFGLAMEQDEVSLSRTGMISGTPAYISPEQAQGRPLDRRTDVYSLGVVLYELLAGVPPFRGGNLAKILVQLVQEDAKPLREIAPSIPEDLETIVAKCLEKDPSRRYESARDLAEDLDRFLDGEPIHARPAGWAYRAGKKLRKNRALAIVSAAALLALLVLGALSLRAQWQARERTELAQRFGQRIGAIQTSLRYEATLPRHDITPHKRRLHQEMESVRAEMRRLGAIAEGPGHSALGQAYLALHQYGAARDHLERAWKAGERGPDVAAALGQTLGYFYDRSRSDPNLQGAQGAAAQASREEADRAYRRPALAYLREAAAEPGSSPYLAALIAYYEKRYPEALAQARRAYLQTPWLHEAGEIEAEVYLAQGSEAGNAGRYDEALRLFDRAGEVYARLLQGAPSDPGLYAGDCGRWTSTINTAVNQEDVPEARVAEALAACERALSVDPGLADVRVLQASMFWRLGDQKFKRGGDPTADLQSGIRLADHAIALDPGNASAWSYLASSRRLLAQWKLGRGLDARADIQRGIETARKAVEAQPGLASAHSGLGNAYLVLVQDQQRRGADPRPALQGAAASYEKAMALNPQFLPAPIGLGNTWKAMAEIQIARGMDPSGSVGKAVAALERAARLNPNSAPIHNNLGNVHLTLGEYLLARGDDPSAALTRAARSYQRATALKPDYSLARYNLGYTWRTLAEALLGQGQDPRPALDSANATLEEALRLNPADADVFLERARMDVIAARWSLGRRQDPGPALRRAAAELARAEALNREQPDVFFTQAEIARYRAETAPDARTRAAALREGLGRVGKALAINAGEARYLALQGLLQYRTARQETDAARRREGAKQAAASLQEALKANPLLARDYGPVLKEARLEAGLTGPRSLTL